MEEDQLWVLEKWLGEIAGDLSLTARKRRQRSEDEKVWSQSDNLRLTVVTLCVAFSSSNLKWL
jgi:hypothetical protein